ncbi:hypothetical protein [Methylomicrobium lacus]|uniref:hypothetical protein n=1 Tax=Methylomicrobium lacus TaxID=136992 RepID=UPI0035A9841B
MISLELAKYFDDSTFVLLGFGAMSIAGTLIAMLLARLLSGKSMVRCQIIFSAAQFFSQCAAAYFALHSGG